MCHKEFETSKVEMQVYVNECTPFSLLLPLLACLSPPLPDPPPLPPFYKLEKF